MLPKEIFEEYGKKRLKELLEKGEKPDIVASFIDFFGDAEITQCSRCGTPVFIRPWILENVKVFGLKVVCLCCADPEALKGQVAMDFARIESLFQDPQAEQEIAFKVKKLWIRIFSFNSPLTNTPYSAWRSPDGKIEIGIHDFDNEIFCIHIVETDQWLLNPRDIKRIIEKIC